MDYSGVVQSNENEQTTTWMNPASILKSEKKEDTKNTHTRMIPFGWDSIP